MRTLDFPVNKRFVRAMRLLPAGAAVLVLIELLAGCTLATTGAGASALPSQIATSTTSFPANPAQTGCPAPTQNVHWSPAPTVVVTPQQRSTSVLVRVGETFEVALPIGHRWALFPALLHPTLNLDSPAGYADAAMKSCIWHFTAHASGQVTLMFVMRPLCPKGRCPQYLTTLDITIQVTTD